ncbi:hypothetical protein CEXT_248051 [Caerostris extrusa]|uniref:Uncharacterized protein n=1 Tax=Caerostris extrusa TaxID=172846 RepID=A0AAV4TGF4_CAEEX|nr:hypothetical protein CEXT_248051 [Caerostris extrusa]
MSVKFIGLPRTNKGCRRCTTLVEMSGSLFVRERYLGVFGTKKKMYKLPSPLLVTLLTSSSSSNSWERDGDLCVCKKPLQLMIISPIHVLVLCAVDYFDAGCWLLSHEICFVGSEVVLLHKEEMFSTLKCQPEGWGKNCYLSE